MRNHAYLLLVLPLLLLNVPATLATEGRSSAADLKAWAYPRAEFQLALNKHFEKKIGEGSEEQQNEPQVTGMKSVSKAVLFSAAVPGSGQIYNGSKLKAAAFLAVEVVGLATYFRFQSRGSDLELEFVADADRLWREDFYWNWISTVSGIDRDNQSALREYERATFSHFLPVQKNQQYYENVGKYDQFVVGWDDFREETLNGDVNALTLADFLSRSYQGQDLTTISEQRNSYVELRRDANDNFKRATNLATLVIFNHIVSAFDAGLTAKRRNQVLMKANIGMQGKIYNQQIVPVLKLGLQW